jgi:hypothetical protein
MSDPTKTKTKTKTKNPLKLSAEKKAAAIRVKIENRAASATVVEVAECQAIVARAKSGFRGTGDYKLTPAMCAWLFVHANHYNREWSSTKAEEYCRRMNAGDWEYNGVGGSFYNTGDVADIQHRLSGCALSDDYTLEVSIAFGVRFRIPG